MEQDPGLKKMAFSFVRVAPRPGKPREAGLTVVAETFERIHRSNLIGMGVLPLELRGLRRADLRLDGSETFDVPNLSDDLHTRAPLEVRIHRADGAIHEVPVVCRIDTAEELTYYRHGGILPYVYRELVAQIRQH